MNNDRGQAAIEYLMNYAWAIALIIIVGIAIFGLNIGGIRNSLTGQASQITQAGEQVAVLGHTCTGSTFTFAAQNNGASELSLSDATVQGNSGASGSDTSCTPSSTTLFPGESTTYGSCSIICGAAGDPYEVGIIVVYTDKNSNIQYKPIRNLTGTVQSA